MRCCVRCSDVRYGRTVVEDTEAHEKTCSQANHLIEEFTKRYGSVNCGDILGCDWPTVKSKGLRASVCQKCVRDAAEIVETLL